MHTTMAKRMIAHQRYQLKQNQAMTLHRLSAEKIYHLAVSNILLYLLPTLLDNVVSVTSQSFPIFLLSRF